MKKLLQTLFFFLLVTQICFAQWYQQNSGTTVNLNAVTFIDANNGYAVGDSSIILSTSNGGINWLQKTNSAELSLYGVCFTNQENGFAVGGPSYWGGAGFPFMLHTTNGGSTWATQSIPPLPAGYLNYIIFVDSIKGFALGGGCDFNGILYSIILKTEDGGATWDSEVDSTMLPIIKGQFVDWNIGWILSSFPNMYGYESAIYKTEDGGASWITKLENHSGGPKIGGDPQVSDIYFGDSNYGIAVGRNDDDGVIYQTTNGGDTWFDTLTIAQCPLNKVHFNTINQGIGVGWNGTILKTADGGLTWNAQISGTTANLNGVFFIDALTGWAVGENGTILHTTNGGVSFVEEEQIDEVPTEYLLSNNFPNPFNPSTKIKYSIPQSSQVTIKVFDILGNEIETLVSEEKPTGAYELNWNAEQLPSGIYFYQLRAGSFIETKKMILLK